MLAKLVLSAAALAMALMFAAPSRAETAARLVRVAEVVSVKIERIQQGDNAHRIVAVGRVPADGWTNARLRIPA